MFLSNLSIARPVAMVMITVALIVFGLIAYQKLGLEDNPEIDLPYLGISTVYPGADPATVESEVTKIIEDEVATISGIKELTSTSSENISFLFIEFVIETDIDVAAQDVRDKMDGIQRSLPDGCEQPVVQKFDPMAASIMDIAIGGDVRPQDLADWVEDFVKPRIEGIDGVGSVDVAGLRDREVKIWLDTDRMASYEISVQNVIGAIQIGHLEIPGGRIETGEREFLVITAGELGSVDAFNDLIVGTRNGVLIRLSDVAVVEDGLKDQRSLARLNGQPAVSLSVIKKSGANTVTVADMINEVVEELKAEAPPGIEISIPRDNSLFTRDSFEQVQSHLYGGGLMAILIVLLFLGNIRTTIIAAISIPTSIITTYIFINAFGFTLNNVTMLALTLMVGMLIDDAIVVLENIYRHTEMGKTPMQAALEGSKEIGFAVLATTLTILAVFIPVANMTGIIGQFMFQYGITVAVGSAISFLVAITLGPMLASRFMQTGTRKFILFRWFDSGFSRLENGYKLLIGAALKRKGITILIAFIAMIASLFLFWMTKKEFFPSMDSNETGISIEMPEGTSLAALSEFVEPLEEMVSEIPEMENTLTTMGSGMYGNQNEGFILIDLVDKGDRDRSVWDIEDELREKIQGIPGAKLLIGGGSQFGTSYGYSFSLIGTDMEELERLAIRFADEMSQDPIFRETDTSLKKGKPEVRISIDRDRAADLGIDIATIGSTLNLLVSGENSVADYMEGGRQSDVKVRLESPYRDRPEDILSLIVYNKDKDPIEVSSFASVEISAGASEIAHVDKMRSVSVYANINDGHTLGEAVKWSNERFATLPAGVRAKVSGEADIMRESFQSMTIALILAIMLIYVVLASQFNHFVHPLTIMTSLPLSFIGAFGLLFLTGMTVNIFSMIGIIMLMGLVTKNAILVVEFANQLRQRGMERDEAMMTAGPIRLRPVLMTALSTIGGMLPVALMLGGGAGVEIRAPMAVAVIGGLAASTLLTLVVIPVVYSLFDQATDWILKVFKIVKPDEELKAGLPDDHV